jgi:hypothetical protein
MFTPDLLRILTFQMQIIFIIKSFIIIRSILDMYFLIINIDLEETENTQKMQKLGQCNLKTLDTIFLKHLNMNQHHRDIAAKL